MTNAAAAVDTAATETPTKASQPYRIYECTLPNGEVIAKRHKTTEYVYVVGCYKADPEASKNSRKRVLHIFRWTGSERTAKRDRNLLDKHEDVLESFICTDIKCTGTAEAAAPSTPRKKKGENGAAPTGDVDAAKVDGAPDFAEPEAETFRTKKAASAAAKMAGFRAKDVEKVEGGWIVSPQA